MRPGDGKSKYLLPNINAVRKLADQNHSFFVQNFKYPRFTLEQIYADKRSNQYPGDDIGKNKTFNTCQYHKFRIDNQNNNQQQQAKNRICMFFKPIMVFKKQN